MPILPFVLIVLLACCLLPLSYLYLLLLASLRKQVTFRSTSKLRFAVAIPAHNEEMVIEGTIRTIRAVDYPEQLVDIYLVADHCEDQTAAIARRLGATVFERTASERGGKGVALAWLFERIFESGQSYDAFTILDADTRLDALYFKIMAARLESGSQAVQGNHIIRNAHSGWFPALTWAMFRIDNRVHNLGRTNLGFSAKNMGDSICFDPEIIRLLCWGSGLVDDYSFRQELLLHGIPIEFEPRAIGYGQAAINWQQAKSQRSRWLMGTYQANRQTAGRMLKEGVRKRNLILLEGALTAYFPSYSTLSLVAVPLAAFSWLVRAGIPKWLPAMCFAALITLIIYPLIALLLDHAPLIAFLVILTGPVYILWRSGVAITTRYIRMDPEWIRTVPEQPLLQ